MTATLQIDRLDRGARVFRSDLWATNSVLVPAGDACLVCDPSIFPDEINDIRTATRRCAHTYLLVTHSHFDHVCGVAAFANQTIVAGAPRRPPRWPTGRRGATSKRADTSACCRRTPAPRFQES